MDKYHYTAIRICKRKEHKAAPRESRHAKMIFLKRSTKDKNADDCRCLRLRRMATDGKPIYDKTW